MNTLSRLALAIILTAHLSPLLAQVNVTELTKQPYYTETALFDSCVFHHRVIYNRPHSVDEEHVYTLQLRFSDFEKIKAGQKIDLATDTALVRCAFGILSVWNWDYDAKAVITGTITIVNKTKHEVVIEENASIRDREGKILIYRAKKTFVPAPKK